MFEHKSRLTQEEWAELVKSGEMSLKRVKNFFFECMVKGWASGAEAELFSFGYKGYQFREEKENSKLVLMDAYCVGDDGNSSGFTSIRYDESPVLWTMYYLGEYSKEAIPILKEALLKAYQDRKFYGGRGINLDDGKYEYCNDIGAYSQKDPFLFFQGKERIEEISIGALEPDIKGWHEYMGKVLVNFE